MPLAALALAALGSGCAGDGEADALLRDYQRQLADALHLAAPEADSPGNIGAFPERRERLFDIAETREGLLNVYALRECHITSLVAARNNQLGRTAPPSQRWLYELKLWRRLNACWQSEIPDELADSHRQRLRRLVEIKTEQLPRVSWNGQFGSEELADSFSRASSPLSPSEHDPIAAQLEALTWLHSATLNQFNPAWEPDSATLEGHLDTLRRRPLTAEVLRSLLLAEQRLSEANALLDERLSEPDTCDALEASGAALRARFTGRPAADWLARLDRLAGRWLEALDALLESHVTPPEVMRNYRQRWLSLEQPDAPLPAFRRARATHREHWRALAARCP